jgi:hypothetical protein
MEPYGRRPPCGSLPFHYLLCNRTHPYPVTLLPTGLGYFRAKPSPVWIPQLFSNLVIIHLLACEDGTDRVFRNVCIQNSDARELPRRKHTTYRTQRKFEIKNACNVILCNKQILLSSYVFNSFCLWFDEHVPVHVLHSIAFKWYSNAHKMYLCGFQ